MNKIIRNKKFYLAIGIVFAIALMVTFRPADAAVSYTAVQDIHPMLVNIPATINTPLITKPGEMVLIDNFEYWEAPVNQGWQAHEPGYPGGFPVWGMQVGPGLASTVLDFQEGSRVLEVYFPANVFVPNMQQYMLSYLIGPDVDPMYQVISLKMRAPVSFEAWDSYSVIVVCNGGLVEVHLTPRSYGGCGANCPVNLPELTAQIATGIVPFNPAANPTVVDVRIGNEAEDGSWHMIRVNLAQALANVGVTFERVTGIVLRGNQFRCDDIKLLTPMANARVAKHPYLFHINHAFTQIFDPVGYRRYIFASDDVADMILPENGNPANTAIYSMMAGVSLAEANFTLWQAMAMPAIAGVDAAIDLAGYQAAVAAYEATLTDTTLADVRRAAIAAGQAIPISIGLGAGGAAINADIRLVFPLDVPLLTDPVMAEGPVSSDGGINMLMFAGNVGGAHELGTAASVINPVSTMDPIPYYPLYNKRGGAASTVTGNSYLEANTIQTVAMALYYAGYDYWPTVAVLQIPPQQIVENMVLTVLVTDGLSEDVESFFLQTVNYPVTNHPPVIQDVEDQIFYVLEGPGRYQLTATDADSFTFSSAIQFENDIEQLIWTAFLEGYPAYQYGPWMDTLINQKTGLVEFEPISEGAYQMVATVRDPKGAEAYAAFTIYCVNANTWLNHPPVLLKDWDQPMIARQGVEALLTFEDVVDPDGEPLFFSCNIGSIGYVNGVPVWSMQTEFPGTYLLEIVAYDMSGGYLVIPQELVVTTWWAQQYSD